MHRLFALSTIAVAALSLSPQLASAQDGLDACGNIHVAAQARCEVVPPSVDCESMCTPVNVRATCSARIAAECEGGCDELPSIDCSAKCVADCTGQCTVDPGKFDCRAACEADCSGHCEAGCAGNSDKASCMSSCEGSCSASCDSSCDVELPQADCDASCEASCEGSCTVDANLDCQVECAVDAQADCEAELTGGCKVDCESEEGALFCGGQYVDYGDNLQQCLDALQNLDIEVEAEAHGHAEGSASSSCGVSPFAAATSSPTWGALGALFALTYRRLRTRRRLS
jgi:hypothetical protein